MKSTTTLIETNATHYKQPVGKPINFEVVRAPENFQLQVRVNVNQSIWFDKIICFS